MKIKKGDQVKVIRGKDAGKTGAAERVFTKERMVLLAGINEYKRHVKARTGSQKSEIKTIAKPLPMANVRLMCPKCTLITRAGYIYNADRKIRICRRCKQEI